MAATRSSPQKPLTPPKTPKKSGTTSRTNKPRAGVTKSGRTSKPTSKARRTQGGRFQSARSSPDTLSPDEIPETELDDDLLHNSPHLHPSIVAMNQRIARLEDGRNSHLAGRRITEIPDRPQRRVRHSSDSDQFPEGDMDKEVENRMGFTHIQGKFEAESLTKLGHGLTHRGDSDTPQDPKGVTQLMQCFGVYASAIIWFARESVRLELTMALEEYRYRLAEYSYVYKFDSLREYNYAFMTARTLEGPDDPLAWRTEDPRCSILLRLKVSPQEATRPSAPKSALPGHGVCRNFNEGRCTREQCRYSHICLNCQQNHPANTCQRPQTSASAANTTPLGNRVSRPD